MCWTETVQIVSLQGVPSTELVFGFPIETIGKTLDKDIR